MITKIKTKIKQSGSVKRKASGFSAATFRYVILICMGLVILKPLYSNLKTAITSQQALGTKNSVWVPAETSAQNFITGYHVLTYKNSGAFAFTILNTLVLTILQTTCAAFAAYSFSRLKFKGSNLLFGLVLFTIVVPPQSIMLAQYSTFRNFDIFGLFKLFTGSSVNLIGSTGSIYLLVAAGMGVKGGLYIYILRQSYRQLPISIEEAAFVDGAGFLKTFIKIVIPSISSSLTMVGVLSFVWNYADTYYISLLSSTEKHLPLRLSRVQSNMRWAIGDVKKLIPDQYIFQNESPLIQNAVAAACTLLVIAPLLILFMFIQKRFIQGVERSGLGGD